MAKLKIKRHRNGTFYSHGTIDGVRVRHSLGTGDKDVAAQLCIQLEDRLWRARIHGADAVVTFAEAADSYIRNGGEAKFLQPLKRHFGPRLLRVIKPGEVSAAASIIYPTAKPATWNRQVITPTRAVINYGHQMGWCSPIRVRRFAETKPKRVAVDRRWLTAFRSACNDNNKPHLAALALFMFQTGTRIGEALGISWDDVNLENREIFLKTTKLQEPRTVHITHEMLIAIANLPRHTTVFRYPRRQSIYKTWRKMCAIAGVDYVPPHQAGRHSFATEVLALGVDTATAMQAGGWKSSRLFIETYAHPDSPGKRVAEAMERQNPDKRRNENVYK